MNLSEMAARAKQASRGLRLLSNEVRNNVLRDFAWGLAEQADTIISENALDLKEAEENGMSKAMLDSMPRISLLYV